MTRAWTHLDLTAEALETSLCRLLKDILVQILLQTVVLLVYYNRLVAPIIFLILVHQQQLPWAHWRGEAIAFLGQYFARFRVVLSASHRCEKVLVIDFGQVARDAHNFFLPLLQRHGAESHAGLPIRRLTFNRGAERAVHLHLL